jgi:hypothetical protein
MAYNPYIFESTRGLRDRMKAKYPEQRQEFRDIVTGAELPTFDEEMASRIYDLSQGKVAGYKDPGRATIGAYDVTPGEQAAYDEFVGTARGLRGAGGKYGARNVDISRAMRRNKELATDRLSKTMMARTMLSGQKGRQSKARIAEKKQKTWTKGFWKDIERKKAELERQRKEAEEQQFWDILLAIIGVGGSIAGGALGAGLATPAAAAPAVDPAAAPAISKLI